MKKLIIALVALVAVGSLTGCATGKKTTTVAPTTHHDMKGEMDYKGEVHHRK
jgi:hypothetical protein